MNRCNYYFSAYASLLLCVFPTVFCGAAADQLSLTPENQIIVDQALANDGFEALGNVPQSLIDWATDDATIDELINGEKRRQERQKAFNKRLFVSASLDPLGIKDACVGLYAADVSKGALVGADFITELTFYTQLQKVLVNKIVDITLTSQEVCALLSSHNTNGKQDRASADQAFKDLYTQRSIVADGLLPILLMRVGVYQGLAAVRDHYLLNDTPQNFSDLIDHIIHPSPNPIPLFALLQMRPLVTLPSDLVQADLSDIPIALANEYGLIPAWMNGQLFQWSKKLIFYAFCARSFYQDLILKRWQAYCTANAELVIDSINDYERAWQSNDYTKLVTAKSDIERHVKVACKLPLSVWLQHKQKYEMLWSVACNTVRLVPAAGKVLLFGMDFYEKVRADQNKNKKV